MEVRLRIDGGWQPTDVCSELHYVSMTPFVSDYLPGNCTSQSTENDGGKQMAIVVS